MKNRIKTGLPGLDKIIEGGFPEKSTILLVGPPGCGKSIFSQQFIKEGKKKKQPGVFVTLDTSPKEIIENMKSFGWKMSMKDVEFIDAYSWRVGEKGGKNKLTNLSNVNDLNIMLSRVIKGLKKTGVKRSVIDSLSTLLIYADPSLVVKLIPVIIAKSKEAGFVQILILEEGVHDDKTVSTLNYIADGLIEFKMEEDKRLFRVDRMKGTKHHRKWKRFEITNKGLKVK